MAKILVVLSQQERWQIPLAMRTIWREAGGLQEELQALVDFLIEVKLVSLKGESIGLTGAGASVAEACSSGHLNAMGLVLLRVGCFNDQANRLLEISTRNSAGDLECSRSVAGRQAGQLVGVLHLWEEVKLVPTLLVPRFLLEELENVRVLIPRESTTPQWVTDRKTVGNRAEVYTLKYERSQVADPSLIVWVAKDSDSFGYDIEDISGTGRRCIEVKGSRTKDVVFNLSDHEWTKAKELEGAYELHFWGEIDLRVDPNVEFANLTAQGYPLRIENLAETLNSGDWDMTPTNWRVARKTTTD